MGADLRTGAEQLSSQIANAQQPAPVCITDTLPDIEQAAMMPAMLTAAGTNPPSVGAQVDVTVIQPVSLQQQSRQQRRSQQQQRQQRQRQPQVHGDAGASHADEEDGEASESPPKKQKRRQERVCALCRRLSFIGPNAVVYPNGRHTKGNQAVSSYCPVEGRTISKEMTRAWHKDAQQMRYQGQFDSFIDGLREQHGADT